MNLAGQFEQWWQRQGDWVEEPNRRRGGESGVQRLQQEDGSVYYAKRQVGHIYRSLRHPFGCPTVLRERKALLALDRHGVRVPQIVYCGTERSVEGWRGLLISAELEGFQDIESWYAAGGREQIDPARHNQLLRHIGAMLARMNLARWQHGCLYAKHVFVKVADDALDVALLDLEKSRRRWTRRAAARHDLRQLRRHSSWSAVEWQQVVYGYEQVFGSTIKRLL
ncbi:lipopolysaccharide kinase InaA family protein [Pseudomonas sp. GOM6]|uniref:lipopolysaccharide kinase InaA family protein n=1 Tax=Pseudomonas sp. GOM6 TaxID=3036944 RepID=UPI00240A25BD|nr:lipopolysaccharide kinase InaA family protein [Pseudomonas sp. GOM6]MDG1579922.1 lipopolysaccharide kinase InaA family protein [Pseudomonas sp. GOM6]